MTLLHCIILAHWEFQFDTPAIEGAIEVASKGCIQGPAGRGGGVKSYIERVNRN